MGWIISLAIMLVSILNDEPSLLVAAGLFAIAGSIGALVAVAKK